MKKVFAAASILFLINTVAFSKSSSYAEIYLITCGPGTETYSVYGHSALRVIIPEKNTDYVYNWGVFDFNTPNFAWKFAKGRLNYLLGVATFKGFLQGYFFEQRIVYSQRINLDSLETERLLLLINENLKPENISYRYDFFYDDCSTRIRDLLEKSIGDKMLYPPVESGEIPTFRDMVGKYQSPFPWLKFGIDLIMGSTSDRKAPFRDRMFLPIDMKDGLSETVINRNGSMIPLLQNPEVILDFDPPKVQKTFFIRPVFVFTLILLLVMIFSGVVKNRRIIKLTDIMIFSVFSILAILMIFFNFFTDHPQMEWNLNIVWLNPVIIICLACLATNRNGLMWFRILFYISGSFLILKFIMPQEFSIDFLPLILILLVRSSIRSDFDWNPLSIK